MWCVKDDTLKFSPIKKKEIPTLDQKTSVVKIMILLFQMMVTCMTCSYLRINISATTTFLKADIWSCHLSTFFGKNTVSTQ